MEISNAELLAQVQAMQKMLAKQQMELELGREREKILKEQSQYDNKELAQIEMMAELKQLSKKVQEQDVKLEESKVREEGLRADLDEQKKVNEELREEIKMKDEIILDLKDRLAQYE